MARRGVRLTDAQWAEIEPLLPRMPRTVRGGRPWASQRSVVDGILWVLKTGARWRDLPAEYPSPSTCWRRLKRWDEDGTWLRIWRAIIAKLDERGRLQWETAFIDGTFASAKKGGPTSVRPSGGKVQSAWYWSSVRVFLWESPLLPRRRQKSRSSTPR
jgi:transposase